MKVFILELKLVLVKNINVVESRLFYTQRNDG